MPTSALTSRAAAESAISTHYNAECVVQNGGRGDFGHCLFLKWGLPNIYLRARFLSLFVDS